MESSQTVVEIVKFNLNEICRACLSHTDTLRPIFDSSILDIFRMCTNLEVSRYIN